MAGFLIRRLRRSVFVLFIVTAATLGLVHRFPGGPPAPAARPPRRPARPGGTRSAARF